MERLKDPLEKFLRRLGLKGKVKERRALQVWPEAAGSKLASVTRALTVKEGILFVQVANSSWAQHLTFFKPALMRKINRNLQGNYIKDIHFQVGLAKAPAPPPPQQNEEKPVLDPEEREKIRNMFADFQGQDIMKEKLMEIMEKELLARKQKAAAGWHRCPRCGTYAPPGSPLCPLCQIQGR